MFSWQAASELTWTQGIVSMAGSAKVPKAYRLYGSQHLRGLYTVIRLPHLHLVSRLP